MDTKGPPNFDLPVIEMTTVQSSAISQSLSYWPLELATLLIFINLTLWLS